MHVSRQQRRHREHCLLALRRRPLHGSQGQSPRLESPRLIIFRGFPCGLQSALLASAPPVLVRADARPPALLAFVPLALVRADARPPALLAFTPPALVLADACPPALLASAPQSLVMSDASPPAILALDPLTLLVLADARPSALLVFRHVCIGGNGSQGPTEMPGAG